MSQKREYIYEMSFQELETGYYFVEYDNQRTDSIQIQICVMDFYQKPVMCDVDIVQNTDTLKFQTNEFGFFYYGINYNHRTLCVSINNDGTRRTNFYKCIHFWDWDDNRSPSRIVIVLGEKEPGIIHIKSKRPIVISDFQEIKNKYLRKVYNRETIKQIQTRRLIYY